MKRSILSDKAQQMYVEELWTCSAIATELGCSERSVRSWAKNGRWDIKRKNFIALQESITDDIRGIAQLLATRIKSQLEDEKEPSPHVLNAFTRIASSLVKAREYDKALEADYQSCTGSDDDVREKAFAKFKEVFGVDLQDDNED